ncbi:MAG: sugar phosphate isomerase/epimerase [Chlamydiae bacterium]|nr:MAG: sugar phosphate isomerase/epimerase [Chlamydiota bacterium]
MINNKILSGLTSITFRGLNPKKIVGLAVKAGLDGIEWGGDIHVPHGDVKTAAEVYKITIDAGLNIIAYGSYYTLGYSAENGLDFKSVLDSATALNAPAIRVWAGKIGSSEANEDYRNKIIEETKSIAKLAVEENIEIAFESHINTLTDTGESSVDLLKKINMENVKTYWQPDPSYSDDENLRKLDLIFPWVKNIHVFQWTKENFIRLPLIEGKEKWGKYFDKISTMENDVYAIMEFVKNDSPEQFLNDAEILKKMIGA